MKLENRAVRVRAPVCGFFLMKDVLSNDRTRRQVPKWHER